MTARLIRPSSTNGQYGHLWSWLLAAAVLLLVLLLIAARVAGQEPKQPNQPNFPFFAAGKVPTADDFDPEKFFERVLNQFGGELVSDEDLDKVQVSWDEELQLGQQGIAEFKQRLAARKQSVTTRGKDVQYLQHLIALIQPQMKQAERYRKLQVHVAEMGAPNAVVFPGGKIVISREMLDRAGCEAALVCVLGHELAHLDRGHLLRRVKQWKLAEERMKKQPAEFTPALFFDQMGLMVLLLRRPFGPEEELDADTDGITWAYRAGYDPLAVEQVYRAMDNAGLSAPSSLPNFLRTHPPSSDRRNHLRATLTQLQAAHPNANLYLGRQNLLRRLPRDDRQFPN